MGKRLQGILIGVVIGVILAGGGAYSVTVAPAAPSDRFYACVNSNGTVESPTLRLNHAPSTTACANTSDTIRSWSAQSGTTALFTAARFGFTSAGCPAGQLEGTIAKSWG